MSEIKKMYKTIMADNFPPEVTITFGGQQLVYKKRSWKLPDESTGELIEKGLRYGENPAQQAAMYELVKLPREKGCRGKPLALPPWRRTRRRSGR